MNLPLFKRTGFLATLMAAALLSLGLRCTDDSNSQAQQTQEVTSAEGKAEIDWTGIALRATQRASNPTEPNKISPATRDKLRQSLLANNISYRDLHKMMREGKLTDVDVAEIYEIYERVYLNDLAGKSEDATFRDRSEIDAIITRDRSDVEGRPEYFTGTWVISKDTEASGGSRSIIAVFVCRPGGTYEYAVAAQHQNNFNAFTQGKQNPHREWIRHKGTYQVNPITESQQASYQSPASGYLYTITFTPDQSTLKSLPGLSKEDVKHLSSNFFLVNQPETFRYGSVGANILIHNLRSDNEMYDRLKLRPYDFVPRDLASLPHLPGKK